MTAAIKARACWILFIFFCTISCIEGTLKVWTHTVSLGQSQQWMDEKLPCPGQRVVLPQQVMFLPSDLTLGPEIVLPRNGLILFNTQRSQISLVDNSTAARARGALNHCSGERDAEAAGEVRGDAVFKEVPFQSWHNPSNWRSSGAAETKSNSSSAYVGPIPHLHRVPCMTDAVIFPTNSAYKVTTDGREVKVGSLEINGEGVDRVTYRSIQASLFGSMMFNGTVTPMDEYCMDPEGCQCGNAGMKDAICSHVTCSYPKCSGALQPAEHCCYDICGAIIHIDTEGKTELKISLIYEAILKIQTKQLGRRGGVASRQIDEKLYHLSRLSPSQYQLVIVPGENGNLQKSVEAAQRIYELLYQNLSNKGFYIWMSQSGVSPPSALTGIGKGFGILFGIGTVCIFLYLAYLAYTKPKVSRPPLEVPFARDPISSISSTFSSLSVANVLARIPRPTTEPMVSRGREDGFAFGRLEDIPVEERVGQSARVDIPSIITFRSLEESANEQELGVSSVNERSFENPTYGQDIDAEKLFAKVTVVPQREDAKDKKTQPHSFDNPMYDQRPNGTKSETEKEKIVESNFEQEQSSLNILVDLEASQKAEIPAKERGNSTTTHGLTTDPMSEEVTDNADEDQQTPPGSMISPSNAEISGLPFTKETPIGSRSESPFMASMSCLQPQSSAKTSPVVSRPQTPSRFLASLLPQQPPPPLTSPSVPVSASNKVIDADDSGKEDGATMSFTANEQEDGFCRTPFQPEKKSHSLDATKVDHGTASDASVQSQAEEYFPVTHGLDEKTPKREEKRDISIFRGDEETHQGQKNLFSEDPAPTQDGESRKMTSAGAAITCENLTQEPGDLQSEGKEAKPRILTRVEGPSSDESDEEIKKETLPTSEP